MPIYEYACNSCKHTFDALQKMSDDKLVDCPECGKPSLRKLLSAPKFRLSGGGWYETDFKTGNKRNIAGDAEKTGTAKEAEPKKSDAKPAAETPAKTTPPKPATDKKAGST